MARTSGLGCGRVSRVSLSRECVYDLSAVVRGTGAGTDRATGGKVLKRCNTFPLDFAKPTPCDLRLQARKFFGF